MGLPATRTPMGNTPAGAMGYMEPHPRPRDSTTRLPKLAVAVPRHTRTEKCLIYDHPYHYRHIQRYEMD